MNWIYSRYWIEDWKQGERLLFPIISLFSLSYQTQALFGKRATWFSGRFFDKESRNWKEKFLLSEETVYPRVPKLNKSICKECKPLTVS